jgi:hypothetical protein
MSNGQLSSLKTYKFALENSKRNTAGKKFENSFQVVRTNVILICTMHSTILLCRSFASSLKFTGLSNHDSTDWHPLVPVLVSLQWPHELCEESEYIWNDFLVLAIGFTSVLYWNICTAWDVHLIPQAPRRFPPWVGLGNFIFFADQLFRSESRTVQIN